MYIFWEKNIRQLIFMSSTDWWLERALPLQYIKSVVHAELKICMMLWIMMSDHVVIMRVSVQIVFLDIKNKYICHLLLKTEALFSTFQNRINN